MTAITLPSGAWLYREGNSHVAIDRLGSDKPAWPAAVCDAVNRLQHAADVRHNPRKKVLFNGGTTPTFTYQSVAARTGAERADVTAALAAADAGDPEPARELAQRYYDEWPADTGWRFDLWHEITRALDERTPVDARAVWQSLKAAGSKATLASTVDELRTAARHGLAVEGPPRSFRRVGSVVAYDPLRAHRPWDHARADA